MYLNLDELMFSEMNLLEDRLELNPNSEGLYFLYNNDKTLMYIGKAKHIRMRLTQHISDSYNNPLKDVKHNFIYFKFSELNCEVSRDIYETYYINKLKPPLNRSKTFTYESKFHDEEYNGNFYNKKLEDMYIQNELEIAMKNLRKHVV